MALALNNLKRVDMPLNKETNQDSVIVSNASNTGIGTVILQKF